MTLFACVDKIPQEILSLIMPYMDTFTDVKFIEKERISVHGIREYELIDNLIEYLINNTKILCLRTDTSIGKPINIEITVSEYDLREEEIVTSEESPEIIAKAKEKSEVTEKNKEISADSKVSLEAMSDLFKYIVKKIEIKFEDFDAKSTDDKVAYIFGKMTENMAMSKFDKKYILLIFQDAMNQKKSIKFENIYMHVAFKLDSYKVSIDKARKYCTTIIWRFCKKKVGNEIFFKELQKVTRLTQKQFEEVKAKLS